MILLEKEVNGQTLKTEFDFDDEHIKLVKDVLKCLEGKIIEVLVGDEADSVVPISILEWFPTVCCKVRFIRSGGSYVSIFNPTVMTIAMKLVIKASELPPVNVFAGEIKLSSEAVGYDDAFCFILAHEIQHAINALNFSYPALTNWHGFLVNIIKIEDVLKTSNFDQVTDRFRKLDIIQDEGSLEEELEMLKKTFGSVIYVWFRCFVKLFKDMDCLDPKTKEEQEEKKGT